MNNKRLFPFAFSSLFLALTGCGGESATIYEDPYEGVKTSTSGCLSSSASCMGFTVAYPVEGLNFDCSSDDKNHFITEIVGNTATGGCKIGDKVSFYIQGQMASSLWVPAESCPPVMPVVRLSDMTTVMLLLSLTASSSPVMPLWVKVESPITATEGKSPASAAPFAMVMDAPMSTQLASALKGGSAPSV